MVFVHRVVAVAVAAAGDGEGCCQMVVVDEKDTLLAHLAGIGG